MVITDMLVSEKNHFLLFYLIDFLYFCRRIHILYSRCSQGVAKVLPRCSQGQKADITLGNTRVLPE